MAAGMAIHMGIHMGTATVMTTDRPARPPIESISSGAAFKDWYWLKTEVMNQARMLGLPVSGGKFEIIDRIADRLDGKTVPSPRRTGIAPNGHGFDWHGALLSRDTIITSNYRNTQNVRRFFISEIGRHFSFNIAFMAWMKANSGKTLEDASQEWKRAHTLTRSGVKPDIPFHNQFNAYTRAFLENNPGRSMDDVRHFWKLKRSLPGHNRYEPSDLDLRE
jgi:Domain of unknown function (DUF6434)/SAP domain-containing new25